MNEEIEYAEMLEIPVSTVNVVKRRRKNKPAALQQSLIDKVNERVSFEENLPVAEDPDLVQEKEDDGEHFVTTVVEDELQPTRWQRWKSRFSQRRFWQRGIQSDDPPTRAEKIVYRVEFACAGALCLAIFLTNVFMPHSAINTFFKTMTTPAPQEDSRIFSDFTLSSVVGEYSNADVNVSAEGVISFTAEGCVYPAVDGVVTDVIRSGDEYTVKIEHAPTFTSVVEGVDHVYYQIGDEVKHNVPVAFSDGEGTVQVTMYSQGELLSCLQIDDENCLAWVESQP